MPTDEYSNCKREITNDDEEGGGGRREVSDLLQAAREISVNWHEERQSSSFELFLGILKGFVLVIAHGDVQVHDSFLQHCLHLVLEHGILELLLLR